MNVYEIVASRIIESLNQGIIPWQKPWYGTSTGAISFQTKRPYSLLNQILLQQPGYYLTFKQVQDHGGKVRKGSKAKVVVFWKQVKVQTENKDGEKEYKLVPILRYYQVFHQSDVEGIEFPEIKTVKEPHPQEAAENIIKGYLDREPDLTFEACLSNEAYYAPISDKVVVPSIEQFEIVEEYYSTAFHELTHSTMKSTRCNREHGNSNAAFGSQDYSKEELVAELGAAALVNHSGLESEKSFRNSAAYIQSWLKVLKDDPKFIVSASGKAEKAVNYILG